MWFAFPFWEMLFYSIDVRKCILWSMCICRDFSNNGLVALPGLQHCWKKLILSGTYKQHGSWSGPASTSCTNCLLSWASNLWSVLCLTITTIIGMWLTITGILFSISLIGPIQNNCMPESLAKKNSEVWKLLNSCQLFSLIKYTKVYLNCNINKIS